MDQKRAQRVLRKLEIDDDDDDKLPPIHPAADSVDLLRLEFGWKQLFSGHHSPDHGMVATWWPVLQQWTL